MKWLNVLLVFVPISIALEFAHASPGLVFLSACLAIVPLAGIIGSATEELAKFLGPTWGGLLNATFGNATELIIAVLAAREGLLDVVKASITGSIIGNLLLVMGFSFVAGGLRHKTQHFNQHMAGLHSSLLVMSVLALMVPAAFVHAVPGLYEKSLAAVPAPHVEALSLGVAVVLICVYLLSLFFSLKTHESLFSGPEIESAGPRMKISTAIWILLAGTLFIALESEFLVGSIVPVTESLRLSQLFVGVVVVAIVGNAAEHAAAVMFARRNHMDVAINIAIGSSTQIALFVAPVLVFASLAVGHPMTLIFNPFELVSIAFAVTITAVIALDGQSHWMEGVLLIAAYIVIAMAFYFIPTGRSAPPPSRAHVTQVWSAPCVRPPFCLR
jgi:Ca2+:H+ antiporter